jgi:hypothetical protein
MPSVRNEVQSVSQFFAIAREREHIRIRRSIGLSAPWSEDPIFQNWRFCNVRREDDRTTVWFKENVRSKLTDLPAVEATLIFRWFNRIKTGEKVLDLLLNGWDRDEAERRLSCNTEPVFTGAYIVRSPFGESKLTGILNAIEVARKQLPSMVINWGRTLEDAWRDLTTIQWMGNFTSYEVVTDLRWTPVLDQAIDINTWACAGPGCARGLGRIYGRPFNYSSSYGQNAALVLMQELLELSRGDGYWPHSWPAWEMREVEHVLCEYDKYKRAESGLRLKRRFV